MKDTLKTGLKVTRRYTIDEPRTIDFLAGNGDGPARVYATPALIGDIERTCREFLLEHLDPGEDTLGTAVNIEHIAPTLLGMWAEVTAEISALNGRALTFAVTVSDPVDDVVARGAHNRFVIDVAKTRTRLSHKAEAFKGAS